MPYKALIKETQVDLDKLYAMSLQIYFGAILG